ncbi:MAG: DNA polymerase Y family protein [Nitrospiraceae bacterium]
MDRHIVCYQIPSFEIAVTRLTTPTLRDRPVAVVPLHTSRALIREVSREAQQEGVVPGMAVEHARRLCPSLQVLAPEPTRVHQAQQALTEIIAQRAPVWEVVRPGHLFLDLTGTTRLCGPVSNTGLYLEREISRRYGLAGSVGVGSNKLVSRLATSLLDPLQLYEVRQGSEPTFMSPLSVTALPWLARAHAKTVLTALTDLNLLTWGDIAEVQLSHLEIVLGQHAGLLHRWSEGIDSTPVFAPRQQPKVDASVTFDPDEIDDARLLGHLYRLLERVCTRLRMLQRFCQRVSLSIRHSDQLEVTRRETLAQGTAWEGDLFPTLKRLFVSCTTRRVRLRAMTVSAEMLLPWEDQLPLFVEAHHTTARSHRLAVALDTVRGKFGERAIWVGRTHGC